MIKFDFEKCKTNYDIANAAITFFSKTKGRSFNGRSCVYRDVAGDRCCAVGAFIPDGLYDRAMEGKLAKDLFEDLQDKVVPDISLEADFRKWVAKHSALLGAMQRQHDDADRWHGPIFNGWVGLENVLFEYPEYYTFTEKQQAKLSKRIALHKKRAYRRTYGDK